MHSHSAYPCQKVLEPPEGVVSTLGPCHWHSYCTTMHEHEIKLVVSQTVVNLQIAALKLCCYGILQGVIGSFVGRFRRISAAITDKRVGLINEVISGALAVKMLGWEDPFYSRIKSIRKRESCALTKRGVLIGANNGIHLFLSAMAGFTTFTVAWAFGRSLDIASVFYVLSLLYIPDLDMTIFFSLGKCRFSLPSASISMYCDPAIWSYLFGFWDFWDTSCTAYSTGIPHMALSFVTAIVLTLFHLYALSKSFGRVTISYELMCKITWKQCGTWDSVSHHVIKMQL